MKRFMHLPFVFALACAGLLGVTAQAADLKLGYVDAIRPLEEPPQAREATQRLQREFPLRARKRSPALRVKSSAWKIHCPATAP